MDDYLEFTATVTKQEDTYEISCPEIGLSLTSMDQTIGLETMKKWTRALVDDLICKDNLNS